MEDRSKALHLVQQVEKLFKQHYPQFTATVEDDSALESVSLFVEDENDEPTYASTFEATVGYDGSVSLQIIGHHSSTGWDSTSDWLPANQIFTHAQTLIKRESDMLPRQASMNPSQAFEHALLVDRVSTRFSMEQTAATKAFIGELGRSGYAIKLEGVDPSFLHQPFGRQMDEWQKIKAWQVDAKTDWISAKARDGKRPLAEVKRWVKAVNPKEFFCKWDTSIDDDSLKIFYKK